MTSSSCRCFREMEKRTSTQSSMRNFGLLNRTETPLTARDRRPKPIYRETPSTRRSSLVWRPSFAHHRVAVPAARQSCRGQSSFRGPKAMREQAALQRDIRITPSPVPSVDQRRADAHRARATRRHGACTRHGDHESPSTNVAAAIGPSVAPGQARAVRRAMPGLHPGRHPLHRTERRRSPVRQHPAKFSVPRCGRTEALAILA
jgi:hypothetical protein